METKTDRQADRRMDGQTGRQVDRQRKRRKRRGRKREQKKGRGGSSLSSSFFLSAYTAVLMPFPVPSPEPSPSYGSGIFKQNGNQKATTMSGFKMSLEHQGYAWLVGTTFLAVGLLQIKIKMWSLRIMQDSK